MPSKITSKKPGKGGVFSKLVDRFKDNLLLETIEVRKATDASMVGQLQLTVGFMNEMTELFGNKMQKLMEMGALNGTTGSYAEIYASVNAISKEVLGKTVNKASGSNWEFDHLDVSTIGSKLVAIYDALTEIKTEIKKSGVSSKKSGTMTMTEGDINTIIPEVQSLIGLASSLKGHYKRGGGGGYSPQDLAVFRDKYLQEINYDLTAVKEHFRGSADGSALMTIRIVDAKAHKNKSDVESNIQHLLTKAITGKFSTAVQQNSTGFEAKLTSLSKELGRNAHTLKGSKPLMDELVDEAMAIATGKKSKRKASKTVEKRSGKKKTNLKQMNPEQVKLLRQKAELDKNLKKVAALALLRSRGKSEKGKGGGLNLEKIRANINKKLPAEIRRNMGRPALTNRTGRFSNSGELTSLRETKAGLSGEFTYLQSPYQTFENTGERRWRAGYNPKPLIAMSIRNLAIQYTNKKLVQLRRT